MSYRVALISYWRALPPGHPDIDRIILGWERTLAKAAEEAKGP